MHQVFCLDATTVNEKIKISRRKKGEKGGQRETKGDKGRQRETEGDKTDKGTQGSQGRHGN